MSIPSETERLFAMEYLTELKEGWYELRTHGLGFGVRGIGILRSFRTYDSGRNHKAAAATPGTTAAMSWVSSHSAAVPAAACLPPSAPERQRPLSPGASLEQEFTVSLIK